MVLQPSGYTTADDITGVGPRVPIGNQNAYWEEGKNMHAVCALLA